METAVNLILDGAPLYGENVLVIGLGTVGLLATALLARFPLAVLAASEPLSHRTQAAGALAAPRDVVTGRDDIRRALEPRGADLIYELSGNPEALDEAIAVAGHEARVVVGSWYGKSAPASTSVGAFTVVDCGSSAARSATSARRCRRAGIGSGGSMRRGARSPTSTSVPSSAIVSRSKTRRSLTGSSIRVGSRFFKFCSTTGGTHDGNVHGRSSPRVSWPNIASSGGDWGKENEWHSHPYRLEVVFEGDALDEHGYLIDISVVEPRLDALATGIAARCSTTCPSSRARTPGLSSSRASSPSD